MAENDNHLQGEIDGFWGDIKATQQILFNERKNLANQLKNGLGNEIKKYLDNPPKQKLSEKIIFKIKRWWWKKNDRN